MHVGMNLEGPHQIGQNITLYWIKFSIWMNLLAILFFCVLSGKGSNSLYN